MPDANGSANGSLVHAPDPPALPLVPRVISTDACEPPMISSARAAGTWRSTTRSL